MGIKVPIMVDLICQITSLPKAGVDPSQYFTWKDNDKKLETRLRNKYGVVKDKRVYVISTINDQEVRIREKLLAMKVVWKNQPNWCT